MFNNLKIINYGKNDKGGDQRTEEHLQNGSIHKD
jgi:hypothetical protein